MNFLFCLACHFRVLKYSEVAISVCFNEGSNDAMMYHWKEKHRVEAGSSRR